MKIKKPAAAILAAGITLSFTPKASADLIDVPRLDPILPVSQGFTLENPDEVKYVSSKVYTLTEETDIYSYPYGSYKFTMNKGEQITVFAEYTDGDDGTEWGRFSPGGGELISALEEECWINMENLEAKASAPEEEISAISETPVTEKPEQETSAARKDEVSVPEVVPVTEKTVQETPPANDEEFSAPAEAPATEKTEQETTAVRERETTPAPDSISVNPDNGTANAFALPLGLGAAAAALSAGMLISIKKKK